MSHKHDPFLDYAMYSSIQSDREHGRPLGCGWIMLLMWGGIIFVCYLCDWRRFHELSVFQRKRWIYEYSGAFP